MNFKRRHIHYLGKDDRLDKIFKSLPINSFIDKGRCGNGGTFLEIYNYLRCSIIIVPNVTITKDKTYPDDKPHEDRLFAIHGDITKEEVKGFLIRRDEAQKIITTPAGLEKVLWAAKKLKMLDEIHNDWFLLLDEAHSAITETHREDVIEVFRHVWDFKKICLISATPFYFTNPKIYELEHHHIKLTENIGVVNLVKSVSVKATVKSMIEESDNNDSKYFIFYNSVTEIASLLEALDLDDCRIYCAKGDKDENLIKLGDNKQYWREQPKNSDFAKINFFTTTAFEGWDMNIPDSVMIVATDIHKPHTLVGIDKCVQALGRARKVVKAYYHIFNDKGRVAFKSLEVIQANYTKTAKRLLSDYIDHLEDAKANGFKPILDTRIEKFCDNPETNPTFNTYKLDRVVNEEYNREVYNHKDFIAKRWAEFYYEPNPMVSNLKWESTRDAKRKSKAKQLEEDYNKIIALKDGKIMFFLSGNPVDNIKKKKNPLAYRASEYLSKEEMKALKHNPKKVEAELIKKEISNKKNQLQKLVGLHFKTGNRYTKEAIVKKLQELYLDVDYRNKKGEPQVALATHIKHFFEVEDCKLRMKDGKYANGFQLNRPTFTLKMAS
jgi:hypothetical protein